MTHTITTDSGLVASLDLRVEDWRTLGAHLATAPSDGDQVEFLLGFMEALAPMQAAYIAARVGLLPYSVADDLAETLGSLTP